MAHSVGHGHWFSHVNAVNPPAGLRGWLTDRASLTLKLQACSRRFRVRPLRQQRGLCLADEYAQVALPRRRRVREREVVLECDGRPMVFAHTILPLGAGASDWPFFKRLGERSLGTALFGDPRVVRGVLQYARLRPWHPLARRASAEFGAVADPLYARRCVYRRKNGVLLVTEVFLPALAQTANAKRGQQDFRNGHGQI